MNDRWIRNMQAKDNSRQEKYRLLRIIADCEDGNFEEFSFLKYHYGLDSHRVERLIGEELRLATYTAARERYAAWLAQTSAETKAE